MNGDLGKTISYSDLFPNRNYEIETLLFKPGVSYLISNQLKFDLNYQYKDKENKQADFENLQSHFTCRRFSHMSNHVPEGVEEAIDNWNEGK